MQSDAEEMVPDCNCAAEDDSLCERISTQEVRRAESLACGMICPECGSMVFFQSGCPLCPSCGFSRCG